MVKANNREYYSQSVQTLLNVHLQLASINNNIEIGVRYRQDFMHRFQWGDGFMMINNQMLLTDRGIPGSESNRLEIATVIAYYIPGQKAAKSQHLKSFIGRMYTDRLFKKVKNRNNM